MPDPVGGAQSLWLPIREGMRQDLDATARPAIVPVALEDISLEKDGRAVTRGAFHRLSNLDTAGTAVPAGARGLYSTGRDLVMLGSRRLWAYDFQWERWHDRGPISPFVLRRQRAAGDAWAYRVCDVASEGGYTLRAFSRERDDLSAGTPSQYFVTWEITTDDGEVIVPLDYQGQGGALAVACREVRAARCAGSLLFVHQQVAAGVDVLFLRTWSTTAPTVPTALTLTDTIATGIYDGVEGGTLGHKTWDVIGLTNGSYVIAYIDTLAQNINLELRSSTHAVTATSTILGGLETGFQDVALCEDVANAQVYVLCTQNGPPLTAKIFARRMGTLAAQWGPTTLQSLAAAETVSTLGCAWDDAAKVVMCAWSARSNFQGRDQGKTRTAVAGLDSAGVVTQTLREVYNTFLISRPWWHDASCYLAISTSVATQIWDTSNFFDVAGVDIKAQAYDSLAVLNVYHTGNNPQTGDTQPSVVAAFSIGAGWTGDDRAYSYGAGANVIIQDGVYRFGAIDLVYSLKNSTIGSSNLGAAVVVTLDATAPITADTSHRDTLCIGGALVSWYDGRVVCELGFITPAMPLTLTKTGVFDGYPDGTYQWQLLPTVLDGAGVVHRGLPSPPVELVLSGAGGPDSIDIVGKSMPATNRTNVSEFGIEVYRAKDDAVYKRVSSPSYSIQNTMTAQTLAPFNNTNLHHPEGVFLYTMGGQLEAVCPEGSQIVTVAIGRVWIANGARLQFSKRIEENSVAAGLVAPEFHESLAIYTETGDDITMLGRLDDKLVVGTATSLYVVTGNGPDNLGLNNDFAGLQLVTTDTGCIEPRSAVSFPGGLMFQAPQGIVMFDRGLGMDFIGRGVEDDTTGHPVVTSATLDAARQRLMFTCTSTDGDLGVVLVYDYEVASWIRWTPRRHDGASVVAVGGCMHRGAYYIVDEGGIVWQQQADNWRDDGSRWIPMAVEFAEVLGGQPGGWQRVSRLVPVVERRGADAGIRVTTTIDGEVEPPQDIGATLIAAVGKVPLSIRPRRHKCHAMGVRVEALEGAIGSDGRGLALSGLLLRVTPRSTPARVATERRV